MLGGRGENRPLFWHPARPAQFLCVVGLGQLPGVWTLGRGGLGEYLLVPFGGSVGVIDSSDGWSSLQILEAYYIKNLKPTIN